MKMSNKVYDVLKWVALVALDAAGDVVAHAGANGQQGHHRANADDDTEHRQHGAQLVRRKAFERGAKDFK